MCELGDRAGNGGEGGGDGEGLEFYHDLMFFLAFWKELGTGMWLRDCNRWEA